MRISGHQLDISRLTILVLDKQIKQCITITNILLKIKIGKFWKIENRKSNIKI